MEVLPWQQWHCQHYLLLCRLICKFNGTQKRCMVALFCTLQLKVAISSSFHLKLEREWQGSCFSVLPFCCFYYYFLKGRPATISVSTLTGKRTAICWGIVWTLRHFLAAGKCLTLRSPSLEISAPLQLSLAIKVSGERQRGLYAVHQRQQETWSPPLVHFELFYWTKSVKTKKQNKQTHSKYLSDVPMYRKGKIETNII